MKLSGRRRSIDPKRTDPNSDPGSLLGEKKVACFRCGREFPESKLKTVPPNASRDQPRIYVCGECS